MKSCARTINPLPLWVVAMRGVVLLPGHQVRDPLAFATPLLLSSAGTLDISFGEFAGIATISTNVWADTHERYPHLF